MSEYDFHKARELSTQRFQALVMAALLSGGEHHVAGKAERVALQERLN